MRSNTARMALVAMALMAAPPAEPVRAAEPGPMPDPEPDYPNRQQRRAEERRARKARRQ